MGLRITTNVSAIDTHRALAGVDRALARSLERLSSGLRVNRASDDAAGLSISEVLRSQFRGNQQAARNIQDAISMLNIADGAANEIAAIVQRMRELAVQSANGTYTDDQRQDMQSEFAALNDEIGNIAAHTEFNGLFLLLGIGGDFQTSPLKSSANTAAGTSESFSGINQTTNRVASVGVNTYTLGGTPEVYGLGTAGNESIAVQIFDSGTGTWRTVNYDTGGGNGYVYNAGTNSITLTGSGQVQAGETQVRISYIAQGSLTRTLTDTPISGSETVKLNGTTLTSGANGYTIAGNTLTITGSARPAAGAAATLTAAYVPTGTTSISLPMTLAANPFSGGVLDPASLDIRVNGASVAFTDPADYTIRQSRSDSAGQTPLYSYDVVLNNTSIDAASASSTPSVQVRYKFDYPTTIAPLVLDIQDGANQGQTLSLSLDRISSGSLGLNPATVDLNTQDDAQAAIAALDGAVAQLNEIRGRYGAYTNRLEHTLNNVNTMALTMEAAFSRIRDTDMAQEMAGLTREQILFRSASEMLKSAQISPRSVLALIQAS